MFFFQKFTAELGDNAAEGFDREHLIPGIICSYLTDSPLSLDSGMPVEPFGSQSDPILHPTIKSPAPYSLSSSSISLYYEDRGYLPTPIGRPGQAPASNIQPGHLSYLAQQFVDHQPVIQQIGLIGSPPVQGLLGEHGQGLGHAYIQQQSTARIQCTPPGQHPFPCPTPFSLCDQGEKSPDDTISGALQIPSISTLLEGMHIPTWEELDQVSGQIRELYALRALLDPQEHTVRRMHSEWNIRW
jgi:hypothetical protein